MSEVLERVEKNGIEKGIEQGKMQEKKETARNLHNMGMSVDFIAKAVNSTVDTVEKWLGLVTA